MSSLRILFVDDELGPGDSSPSGSYMWYYTTACREDGFDVLEKTGIDDALGTLRGCEPIDLIVIDALMPLGDESLPEVQDAFEAGYLLARTLSKELPDLPAIILTNANAVAPIQKLRKLPNIKRILFKADTPPHSLVGEIRDVLEVKRRDSPESDSVPHWKSLIHGRKLAAFEKFLSQPDELSPAEFLLLSDSNHALIQTLISSVPLREGRTSPWATYTNQQLVTAVPRQEEPKAKGDILEELMLRLFRSIEGFEVKTRVHTETEEIDVFILNGSVDAPWRDMGPALVGECKNWSVKCGTPEYDHFESKVRNRHGQCKCGFFISWNGFTSTFTEQRLRSSREGFLIVQVHGKHIEEAVIRDTFSVMLKQLWEDSVNT